LLGEPSIEHRSHRAGFLVRIQLFPRDVLDCAVSVLGFGIPNNHRDLGEPELGGGRRAMESCDEIKSVAGGSDDYRNQHALKGDRASQRVDVILIQVTDVLRDPNGLERGGVGLRRRSGHEDLLWSWARPVAGRSQPARTPRQGRATLGGWSGRRRCTVGARGSRDCYARRGTTRSSPSNARSPGTFTLAR
jgi:hypothetical protein